LKTKNKIKLASILSKILIFLLGKKKLIVKRNSIFWNLDLEEGIDLKIFLLSNSERKILNLQKIIASNEYVNFIDCGANIGSTALTLAKFYNNAKIFAIEPTFYAFDKLKKNIKLNPILKKRIKIFNYFISNKKKKIENVYSSWNFNSKKNKHKIHLGTLKKINKKNVISLDKLIKKIKEKIDFIKIDADGHEYEILKSGVNSIKKYKPIIHIEFAPYLHKEFKYSSSELIYFIIKKLNYEFYNEDFKKINDIGNYIKKIIDKSENFFLIRKIK
jgi:FkbM family methyltransferase